jgi:formate dehydrogenase subunit delta
VDLAKLTLMANQIARNFAVQGDERAVTATAEHINLFWDPRMKAEIAAAKPADLSPIAAAAVNRLVQTGRIA